jgi:hypothetical protein
VFFLSSKNIWRHIPASKTGKVLQYKKIFPFDGLYPVIATENITQKMFDDSVSFASESFYLKLDRVFIEPTYFNVLKFPVSIIKESQFYSWQKISLKQTLRHSFFHKNKREVGEAVLFDSFVGLNYFHFYNDVFPIVFAIYSAGLSYLPILIGEKLYMTKWFQYFLRTPLFADLNWQVVGKDEFVETRTLHLLRPPSYSLPNILSIRNLDSRPEPRVQNLRLFVTRTDNENRHIVSMAALGPYLSKHGFTIINLAALAVEEQIELFRKSEVIAGPHGAGLTNLIFSTNTSLKIIEIFPSNFISAHYYWLSSILGITYSAFLGSELKMQEQGVTGFEVDTEAFDRFLNNVLGGT